MLILVSCFMQEETKIQKESNFFVYLMGEEISNIVNLDLNLGPDPELSFLPVTDNNADVYFPDLGNGPSNRESEPLRSFWTRHGSRLRQVDVLPVPAETHSPLIELSQLVIPFAHGAALPAGEEESKKCENGNKVVEEDNVKEEKRVVEKSVGSEGSFFDCYVCLDLSKDPVVTNCGHLFCWSCLYRWLQVSEAKECPVCKGEVSFKTLTPIYGRGEKNKRQSREASDTNKIPSRPQARRVDSLRTTLERSGYIETEMMRNLHNRLERESRTGERPARPFLNRFMTSRGVRAEHNQSSAALVAPLDNVVSSVPSEYERESRQLRAAPPHGMSLQRQMQAGARDLRVPFPPVLTSAERLEDTYLVTHAFDEQLNVPSGGGGEDRDSFSSIIGVMNSESQVDTAAEIDSMVTVSTSSSVRRPHENGSRVSDVDSADSRPLRRRRLA